MIVRWIRVLVWVPLLLVSFALAQDARFSASFVTMDGEPTAVEEYASGDHLVLHVEVRNDSDVVLTPDGFWVGFPPVEGATLHSSTVGGYSFPDRMLDADGNDVEPSDGAHQYEQLHELPEELAPGEVGAIDLKVTVLSSRNTLDEVLDEMFLIDAEGRRFGTRVDDVEARER
jgi:hypothetical protein